MPGETVTRIRRGEQIGTDAYNKPIYGPDTETDFQGAFVAFGDPWEAHEVGRNSDHSDLSVFFPNQYPDIVGSDRLRVRGVEYPVMSDPPEWKSPWGSRIGGLLVRMRKEDG